MLLLLLVLVGKELLGIGGPPDASLPKGSGGVEADKEAFEMQASAGAGGKGGATIVPKDPEDRPAVTKDQVVVVTGLTATMLFLYDGLQVRQRPPGRVWPCVCVDEFACPCVTVFFFNML